ncbi:MAG: GerMN domain-containing protein [Vicinamibacterales bacterium]
MRRLPILVGSLLATALLTAVVLFLVWPRPATPGGTASSPQAAEAADARRIKATLFYVSSDGARLVPVEREVPFGEGTLEQARRILMAQLGVAPPAHASAIPPGTRLRAIYVTEGGEAFVDLSDEVTKAHPGGATTELLTVYTIVGALTANLPAITAVQILVNGTEVDTLAGHVDLRRPLQADREWLGIVTRE